ncbi:MAG: metal-dependent transcriptional regulator [Promethearchaeota archaeon]
MIEIRDDSLEYKILIAFLNKQEGIRPGELKKDLGAKHSTINSVIRRMEGKGLLKWQPYGRVNLTPKGVEILNHIEMHHHLIEIFLVDCLNLTPDDARLESLRLAPNFSCELIKRICEKYGQPRRCPSNKEIVHVEICHSHT